MMKNGTQVDTGFPPYPKVADLPVNPSEEERFAFACKLIEEQGDLLGDYLFAAVRNALDPATMMAWANMSEYVATVHGGPIHLTYRACDRMAIEGDDGHMPFAEGTVQ